MPKELPKKSKAKAPKAALTSGQVYWLQIGFDAEEHDMLETVIADKKMPAAMTVRQLILAEYRRLKG